MEQVPKGHLDNHWAAQDCGVRSCSQAALHCFFSCPLGTQAHSWGHSEAHLKRTLSEGLGGWPRAVTHLHTPTWDTPVSITAAPVPVSLGKCVTSQHTGLFCSALKVCIDHPDFLEGVPA